MQRKVNGIGDHAAVNTCRNIQISFAVVMIVGMWLFFKKRLTWKMHDVLAINGE
jgi:hypothetical protein